MNKSLLLLAAFLCIGLGVLLANPIADYGVPVSYAKGRDIAFADFTMRYLGERHVKSPVFKPTNVTVQSARTVSPSGTPVSLSRPDGTSTASTGRPELLIWRMTRAMSSRAGPRSPVPSNA